MHPKAMAPEAQPAAQSRPSRVSTRPFIFAMLTRGSAPPGTFDIPEGGLPVPHPKSFLERFQEGLPVAESALQKYTQLMATVKLAPANKHAHEHKKKDLRTSVLPVAEDVKEEKVEQLKESKSRDSRSVPGNAKKQKVKENEQPSELEIAADVVEDSLIEIVDEQVSLLSDRRASYPVLRFCAANALLDRHALDTLGLPLGFVWAPFEALPNAVQIDRNAKRCSTCGSFLAGENGGAPVLKGAYTWTCAFCGRDDNDVWGAALKAEISKEDYPELTMDVVEYVRVGGGGRNAAGRGAIVLVVDENVEEEEAKWAREAAAAVHASAAERGLRFALLTVGVGCSVATGVMVDEEVVPVMDLISVERAAKLTPEEKEQYFLNSPNKVSGGTSSLQEEPAHSSVVTDPFIRSRMIPGTVELAGEFGGLDVSDDEKPVRTRFEPENEQRRLDLAINIAFELISGMADAENSRVLCLVTGPPTIPLQGSTDSRFRLQPTGKSSVDDSDGNITLARLYEQIGVKAGDLRIALDFLCFATPQGFASSILLNATKRSRGGLVYTAVHGFSAASSLAEAATYLSEGSTTPGVVSIRISAPLSVARVIAPAFPTAAPHTYAVPGIDPTIGFTVILKPNFSREESELEETEPPVSHAIIQLAAKSLESTRVITVRVPITVEASEYLNNLDPEVSALVLGKACVVSGGALTQPSIAARSIDVSARRLLRGAETTAGVVRLLYELRRGLLIDRQINPDCGLVLRALFLRSECAIASLLMSPRLFTNAMSDQGTGLMAEVPLEKSNISKEAVLVLDTGYNVFVYVGEEASVEAEEAISESARSVAAQRLSPCQLWKIYPGPDADYLLDWYLSPSDSRGLTSPPTDRGFIPYCKALAPESITVRLLQST